MDQSFMNHMREEVRELPVYIPGKPVKEVQRELGLSDVIKLASNENPWGPSRKAIEAIQESVKDIARYPEASGYDLREALSDVHGVAPDYFLFGSGSDEIVQMIAGAFFHPGDEILMGTPSFPRYLTVAQFIGAKPIEVSLKDGYYPLEDMLTQITDKTRAIFICNPNNPSGTARSEKDIREFVNRVPSNIILIFDEAYFEFMDEDFSGTYYLNSGRPIIVLRTFSKAYGLAGLRIGYAIAHPQLIQGLDKVRGPFNVNSLAFAAALAALKDQEYLNEVVNKTKLGRKVLTEGLQKLRVQVLPSQTNFILAFFQQSGAEISQGLLNKGIIVRSGTGFGYPNATRITVGTPEENETFLSEISLLLS